MHSNPHRLLSVLGLAAAALTTGASLAFFEESLPSTMNPLFAQSMVDNRVHELVMDRIYFNDPINNELVSNIVQEWALVESGKSIRLVLRKGVKWQDGEVLGADDICFTVKAMLDKGTPSPVAEEYRTVLADCEVQGNQVALIRFTKVFHNPRERLGFAILPEASFQGTAISPDLEFSARPIGTGPYKGSRGRRGVTFDAFGNGHHNASIAQFLLAEGGDPLVQVKTIINNGVQGILAVPPNYRPDLSSHDEVALKSYDLRSWWFVAVNTSKGAMADKRVRQALNMMLDRTELRLLTIGVKPGEQNSPCEFISGPFVQSSPYYNRAVPTVDRSDRNKADALLTAAWLTQTGGRWHYKGNAITLCIGMLAPLDNEAPDLLSQIGNQLGAGGFDRQEFKISPDEWTRKVLTGQATDYDLVVGKWSFGIVEDVNDLFQSRKGSNGKQNIFNYSNPDVDALMTQYDAARTDTAAQDAYHALHAKLADELPYLFMWKLDTKSAWRTEVRGNVIAPYYYFTEIDSWKYGK